MSDPSSSGPAPVPGDEVPAVPQAPSEAPPPGEPAGSSKGTFWTVLVIVGMFLVNIWVYSPLSNKVKARPSPAHPGAGPRPPAGGGDPGARPGTPGSRVAQVQASRTPGDGPHSPGDAARTPGDGPRTPGDGPRSPGDAARTPGDGPRSPGDAARTPGDGPRSPGGSPRSPLDAPPEGSPRPGVGDRDPSPPPPGNRGASPPPPPGADRQKSGNALSFRQLLGVAMLDTADASLRLDATQKAAIRADLREALPKLEAAYRAQGDLQEALTNAQIAYLNTHRGSLVYKGQTMERPEPAQVLSLLDERMKEAPAATPVPAPSGSARERFALDLDDLLGAPVRLEADASLKLSPSQAERFRAVLVRVKEAGEVESRLSTIIDKTLRPEQLKFVQNQGAEMEALRHTIILALVAETLSRTSEK